MQPGTGWLSGICLCDPGLAATFLKVPLRRCFLKSFLKSFLRRCFLRRCFLRSAAPPWALQRWNFPHCCYWLLGRAGGTIRANEHGSPSNITSGPGGRSIPAFVLRHTGVFCCPRSFKPTISRRRWPFRIWTQRVTFETWDPSDILSKWCLYRWKLKDIICMI